MGTRCKHRPRAVYPGSLGGVAAPFVLLLCPCVVRHTHTGPTRIPCSVVPPPRSSSSTYRILGPVLFLGLSRLVISSYPPRLPAPLNTRPSRPSFTAALTRKVSKCWPAASEAIDGVFICCGVCAPCSPSSSRCTTCCGASSSTTIPSSCVACAHSHCTITRASNPEELPSKVPALPD